MGDAMVTHNVPARDGPEVRGQKLGSFLLCQRHRHLTEFLARSFQLNFCPNSG